MHGYITIKIILRSDKKTAGIWRRLSTHLCMSHHSRWILIYIDNYNFRRYFYNLHSRGSHFGRSCIHLYLCNEHHLQCILAYIDNNNLRLSFYTLQASCGRHLRHHLCIHLYLLEFIKIELNATLNIMVAVDSLQKT